MTTVKINENVKLSASQQAVAKAAETFQVTDERGRKITLKKPGALAQFRLIDMLGNSASNETYVAMVLPLIFITDIDGEFVLMQNRIQLDALIQQLEQEGINAVHKGVQEHFGKNDSEADREALKK